MNGIRRALVSLDEAPPSDEETLVLCPERNLRTGVKDFASFCPNPTSLERDLLLVASTIYACDLAFKRGERENITRSIEVKIPVINFHAFEHLKNDLISILWILSHDSWDIQFERSKGTPEETVDWPQLDGKTLLFSGGLDSFAGAVDLIDELGPKSVQLASHVTANQVTRSSQNDLINYLEGKYGTTLQRIVVRTGGWNYKTLTFPSDREETQRTRSFMFLAIAALGARRSGHSELVMIAENGQMAIHLPLSAARIGAFSTHTAHPDFVHSVGEYFTKLLGYPIRVTNPYLYRTKAEVIAKLAGFHGEALKLSVSCWRGSWLSKGYNHCGECVPCLIRRIATEFQGIVLAEYERDLWNMDVALLSPDDEGKRNTVELAEFAYTFNFRSDAEIEYDYPDLISEHIDREEAIAMYRRFADEARQVLSRYGGVVKILPSIIPPIAMAETAAKRDSKPRRSSARRKGK